MINKKKIFIFILVFLFFNLVSATITVDIEVKESFGLGEIIGFNYTIKSDTGITIQYFPSFTCDEFQLSPMLIEKELVKNIVYEEYYEGTSTNIFEGNIYCSVVLEIISPVYVFENKSFIVNATPSFMFNIDICKDFSCSEKLKVFIQGEDIYLDYGSNVENPSITATLTYPDDSTKSLGFPTSIKAEQVGTYELQVTASKEGYKTISLNEQFGVIEGEADISYVDVDKNNLIYYLIGGCVVLVILFIIYLTIRKKRKH